MAGEGGCAREYAEQARKALQTELEEIGRVAVREYLIAGGTLSYKDFEAAIVKDFGERFRPYTFSLWTKSAVAYERLQADHPEWGLPDIERKPADFIPDYHNLDTLSDMDAIRLANQNLADLARENAFTDRFRDGYESKPLSVTEAQAAGYIGDPALLAAISQQFSLPLDAVIQGQVMMMKALNEEVLEKNALLSKTLDELLDLREREAKAKGSTLGKLAAVESEYNELATQAAMVADMARYYTALAEGSATGLGRAMRSLRDLGAIRKKGGSGEAFVALFGSANKSVPVPLGMPKEEALKVVEGISLATAEKAVEKARSERITKKRSEAPSNRITGKFGDRDLFGDPMPFAPMNPAERKAAIPVVRKGLKAAGATKARTLSNDKVAEIAEKAKLLKAMLAKKSGAC